MAYTNLGLVNHAKYMLSLNTRYMWGGIARPITNQYIDMLAKQYTTQYSNTRTGVLKGYVGKNYFGVDCVGLIKSYYWSGNANGGTGSPKYSATTDVNTEGMYAMATVKGKINTLPEQQGVIVLSRTHPHVGVYIGNGEVIESTLSVRGDGVVKTKLKDFAWEYWFECPFIEYVKTNTPSTSEINTSEKSGKKRVCEGFSSWEINGIYKAVSQAAIRDAMSKNSNILSRCVNGNYYPMDRYVEMDNGSVWYRHCGAKHYSMKKDNIPLFEQVGTYKKYKAVSTVNVRIAPTLSAALIGKVYSGKTIYVFITSTTRSDGYEWKKIIYNGKICYCTTKNIKEI